MRAGLTIGCMVLAAAAVPQGAFAQARARSANSSSSSSVMVARNGSYLGIGVEDVDSEKAKNLKLKEERGALITSVTADGPAAKAGIKEGDVIMDYNGTPIQSIAQLQRLVSETPAGRQVKLEVWRNGAMQTLTATIAEHKMSVIQGPDGNWNFTIPSMPAAPMPPMPPSGSVQVWPEMPNFQGFGGFSMNGVLGITGEALNQEPQFAEFLGVKNGVLVKAVNRGSAAEKAGIKAGDVIVKVDDTAINNTRDITMALRGAHGSKSVTVVRNKKEMQLTVTMEESGKVRAAASDTVEC